MPTDTMLISNSDPATSAVATWRAAMEGWRLRTFASVVLTPLAGLDPNAPDERRTADRKAARAEWQQMQRMAGERRTQAAAALADAERDVERARSLQRLGEMDARDVESRRDALA